ncbi:MAG: hypothetical protein AAGA77_21540 [Bacteroidota bacterium]
MNQLKSIWYNTYLGKLFTRDPIFARVLSGILILYVFIHIFRLELYPLYMFAMFSKQEQPREFYHSYTLYNQEKEVDLNHWNYREYTVFMNTIVQYDALLNNNMVHPEAEAIDKFIRRLRLQNTGLKKHFKSPFIFTRSDLEKEIGPWIAHKLKIEPQDLKIEKTTFSWKKATPLLKQKSIIYGKDQ